MRSQSKLNPGEMEIEYCDSTEGVTQCEKCKNRYCGTHFDKHNCNGEEEDEKNLVAAEKSRTENNNNASHSVTFSKSGEIDINTFNKIDTVLEIHHIDVGQGDSTLILIKSYKNDIYKSILIDSGKTSEKITDYFDQLINKEKDGEKYFRPIDIFITTHPDKDHVGGAPDILIGKNEEKEINYTNPNAILYDNGMPYGKFDREYETYLACAEKKGFDRWRPPLGAPIDGGKVLEEHGVILRCLAFNGVMSNGYSEKSPYHHLQLGDLKDFCQDKEQQMIDANYPTNDNNLSVALHLQFGKFSYFTAGDLSGDYEKEVTHHINHFYGPVSAWKASHHGAKECTSEIVTGYLQGGVCVFSFGTENEFGHPFQAPIDHLENLNKAGVPCFYYCTGHILRRESLRRQYGKLGDHGLAGQGTVILRAFESEIKASETFYVETSKSNDKYQLESRKNGLLLIEPSESKGKSGNPFSENQKAEKAKRKIEKLERNLAKAHEKLKKMVLEFIGKKDDEWDKINTGRFKELFEKKVSHLAKSVVFDANYDNDRLAKGRVRREAEELSKIS